MPCQIPAPGAVVPAAASRSARARRRRRGITMLALMASPPRMTPSSNATISATPRLVGRCVNPRSIETSCRLSAPITAPTARQAIAISKRIRRMAELRTTPCTGDSLADVPSAAISKSPRPVVLVQRNGVAHALAQLLAGLGMRDVLARQCDRFTGLGIAPQAGRTVVQREAAETADLDAFAVGQCAAHHLKQRLDRKIHVLGLQVGLALGKDFDQFGLGHGWKGTRLERLRAVRPQRGCSGLPQRNGPAGAGPFPVTAMRHASRSGTDYSDLLLSCSRSRAPSLVVPLAASAEAAERL